MKLTVGMLSLGLALVLPALGASQQKSDNVTAATSAQTQVCAPVDNRPLAPVNAEYVWRLRAYEDLDCALAILDEALETEGSVITLSRHEAERARTRVWSARDAAARIGR